MRGAPGRTGEVPVYEEARFILRDRPGEPLVMGCDSTSLVTDDDLGRIVVTGSHGDLLCNDPSWGKRPDVLAVVFNDAGIGHRLAAAGLGPPRHRRRGGDRGKRTHRRRPIDLRRRHSLPCQRGGEVAGGEAGDDLPSLRRLGGRRQ